MYDPTIGRWLTEDPLDFTAGDTNLYRYVGNSPTTRTDPSGLQEQRVPQQIRDTIELNNLQNEVGRLVYNSTESLAAFRQRFRQNMPLTEFYRARISFTESGDSVRTIAKRIILRDRINDAVDRISRASFALEHQWAQVQQVLPNETGLHILFGQGMPTDQNRDFYRTNFARVIARMRDPNAVIYFHNNDRNTSSNPAYMRGVSSFAVLGDTIYINPDFFEYSSQQQTTIIAHELGRLIGRISGNPGSDDSTNSIQNWDTVIYCLTSEFAVERIRAATP